jgi:hypothetical protein
MSKGRDIPRLGYDSDYAYESNPKNPKNRIDSFSVNTGDSKFDDDDFEDRNDQIRRGFTDKDYQLVNGDRHVEGALGATMYDNVSLVGREAVKEKNQVEPEDYKTRTSRFLASTGSNQLTGNPTDYQFSSQAHAKVFSNPYLNNYISDFNGGYKKSRRSRKSKRSKKSRRSRKSRKGKKTRKH